MAKIANSGDICYTSRDIENFVLKLANFRYHCNKGQSWINLRDIVKLRDLKFPLLWHKDFGDICYISKDRANLVLNFTNFRYYGNKGRCRVNFNDAAKLCDPVCSKNLGHIYYTGREMANFALKFINFRYHGNKGRSWVIFRDTVKLHDLKNPLFGARISAIYLI